jgi:hypothetical protein
MMTTKSGWVFSFYLPHPTDRSSGAEHCWDKEGGLAVDPAALQICNFAAPSKAREVRLSSIRLSILIL